jgi:hypothetical protein
VQKYGAEHTNAPKIHFFPREDARAEGVQAGDRRYCVPLIAILARYFSRFRRERGSGEAVGDDARRERARARIASPGRLSPLSRLAVFLVYIRPFLPIIPQFPPFLPTLHPTPWPQETTRHPAPDQEILEGLYPHLVLVWVERSVEMRVAPRMIPPYPKQAPSSAKVSKISSIAQLDGDHGGLWVRRDKGYLALSTPPVLIAAWGWVEISRPLSHLLPTCFYLASFFLSFFFCYLLSGRHEGGTLI